MDNKTLNLLVECSNDADVVDDDRGASSKRIIPTVGSDRILWKFLENRGSPEAIQIVDRHSDL